MTTIQNITVALLPLSIIRHAPYKHLPDNEILSKGITHEPLVLWQAHTPVKLFTLFPNIFGIYVATALH